MSNKLTQSARALDCLQRATADQCDRIKPNSEEGRVIAEYIERGAVCAVCNNQKEFCGKEKCPVYKVPTAEVEPVKNELRKDVLMMCEYCHSDRDGYSRLLPRIGKGNAHIQKGIDIGWIIDVSGPNYTSLKISINYCPKCGRKLRNDNG